MNITQFVFFDTTSTSTTSNVFGNVSQGSAMTIEINDFGASAALSLKVEGSADMTQNGYYPIKVIALKDFSTKSTITEAGLYMVIIDGVSRVRMVSDVAVGNFKAFAVSLS